MEIRNLISFVHVAELKSFTKAAHVLGYSQSTISFQIKQLETELDCLLFERINHKIMLTDKGNELLLYAQSISSLTEEFMQNFTSEKELTGTIHFGCPDSICEDMLVTNYFDFHRNHPGINLKFTNADTTDMFAMLDSNEADAIITLDNHIYRNDYIIAKETPVRMIFVANKNSPLARKKNLSFAEIANNPFILTEKGMGYRGIFDETVAKKSLDITPVLEVGRTDIICKLLEENDDCISFLPYFAAKERIEAGKLICLDITDFEANIWKQLIYRKSKWLSNCLKAFLEYVKDHEF